MSANFYVKALAQFGYDLRPLRAQMNNIDHKFLQSDLTYFAMQRLIRRTERGQSISRYLSTKNFASVRVLRSPETLKILSRLLWENVFAEKIFIRDVADIEALLHDLTPQKLPHLLITFGGDDDKQLIISAERRGMIYGEHVISFRREYLRHCEELFNRLGK